MPWYGRENRWHGEPSQGKRTKCRSLPVAAREAVVCCVDDEADGPAQGVSCVTPLCQHDSQPATQEHDAAVVNYAFVVEELDEI